MRARFSTRCGMLGAALVAVLLVGASPGRAQVAAVNHLTVRKVVIGPAPAGAVFTVHVGCTDEAADPVGVFDQTFTFHDPGGDVTVDIPAAVDGSFVLCSLEETAGAPPADGRPPGTGYGLSYGCAVTDPGTSTSPGDPAVICGPSSRVEEGVQFPSPRTDAAVTVTVTNWFVEPAPPAPLVEAPLFTG